MLGHCTLSLSARLSLHRTPLAYNEPSLGALGPCAGPGKEREHPPSPALPRWLPLAGPRTALPLTLPVPEGCTRGLRRGHSHRTGPAGSTPLSHPPPVLKLPFPLQT